MNKLFTIAAMFAIVSDNLQIVIILAALVIPTITAIGGVLVSVINARRTGAKLDENAKESREAVSKNAEKVQVVHDLVNSQMVEQKHISAMFARRTADATHDPKDIALADEAEKIYAMGVKAAKDNLELHKERDKSGAAPQ